MADKYLKQANGRLAEVEGLQSSAGAGDAGKIPALDAAGKLDASMMPTGIAADTASIVASENLAAGDLVNIYDNSGTSNCRKADGTTTGKPAHGFVLASVTSSASATVYFAGSNSQVSGLTPGPQYLSGATAGLTTHTPVTGSGKTLQRVGVAIDATTLKFEPDTPIDLA